MRTITTKSSGHTTAEPARTSRQHPLLPFACARWLELSSLAERSKAIGRRRSQAIEPRGPIPNPRTLPH
jgi:hypothetical protein